jgi:hypothetical protein
MPLLEEVGYVPKWKYAPGEEIRQHARAIGRHFDLYRDACFQTRVTELTLGRHRVGVARHHRPRRPHRARYVVVSAARSARRSCPASPASRPSAAHLPHQPLGLRLHRRRRERRPDRARRQAGRRHRHRRDRHPGRAAPRAATPSSCTCSSARPPRSTYAATGPPTRSGPSRWSRAGSGAAGTTSLDVTGGPRGRGPGDDGWTSSAGCCRPHPGEHLRGPPAEERTA